MSETGHQRHFGTVTDTSACHPIATKEQTFQIGSEGPRRRHLPSILLLTAGGLARGVQRAEDTVSLFVRRAGLCLARENLRSRIDLVYS